MRCLKNTTFHIVVLFCDSAIEVTREQASDALACKSLGNERWRLYVLDENVYIDFSGLQVLAQTDATNIIKKRGEHSLRVNPPPTCKPN